MRRQKVVILNITHGDNPYMDKFPFLPIAAGACRSDITTDADGEDNISEKNKWYGDFTSLYWAWKNLKGVDIIGTSHYRRYLVDDDTLSEWQNEYILSWEKFSKRHYHVSSLIRLLNKCDFVMLQPMYFGITVREQYIENHPYPQNLELVTEVLQKIHPSSVSVWKEILDERSMQPGFLFLTHKHIFDELCEWLYPVLNELEVKINLLQYEGYQSRVIAFLYERLVPVFIRTKGYSIEHRAIYMIGPESKNSVRDYKKQYKYELWLNRKRKVKRFIKRILMFQ